MFKKFVYLVLGLILILALELVINTFRAPVDLGESERFTEKELRSAVLVIRLDCLTDPDYRLRNLRYIGDELSLIRQEYLSNFPEEYGDFDECAVFMADFHSPRHWSKAADDLDWEIVLGRKAGGSWRILRQGES